MEGRNNGSDDSLDSDSWNNNSETYVQGLIAEAESEVIYHKNKETFYNFYKHFLGVPSIVLGCVMAILDTDNIPIMVVRICFVMSSILSSLNYYFNWGKRSQIHRNKADRYLHFIHKSKKILVLSKGKRKSCREVLTNLNIDINNIRTADIASPALESPMRVIH